MRLVIRTSIAYTKFERTFESSPFSTAYGELALAAQVSERNRSVPAPTARFDRRLAEILTHATDVFCKKGYEGASMRDLSRTSGISLAGLYYYFESKERLLFLIQKHTFTTIVQRLNARLRE